MKNRKTKMKSVVFAVAMSVGLLSSMTTLAQSDGFFRGGGDYMNRDGSGPSGDIVNQVFGDNGGNTVTNQSFGEEAPLGSGLLIMIAAGAGYTVLKRKRK